MNPLAAWHVYLGATVVGVTAFIASVVIVWRNRLQEAST